MLTILLDYVIFYTILNIHLTFITLSVLCSSKKKPTGQVSEGVIVVCAIGWILGDFRPDKRGFRAILSSFRPKIWLLLQYSRFFGSISVGNRGGTTILSRAVCQIHFS